MCEHRNLAAQVPETATGPIAVFTVFTRFAAVQNYSLFPTFCGMLEFHFCLLAALTAPRPGKGWAFSRRRQLFEVHTHTSVTRTAAGRITPLWKR